MAAEVKRIYHGAYDFSHLDREAVIILNSLDHRAIVDIDFMLYQEHGRHYSSPNSAPVGIEKLKIYLNDYEITDSVLSELVELLRVVPERTVREKYRVGVHKYTSFLDAVGERVDERSNDLEFFETYLETNTYEDFLNNFGERTVGWGGNLHITSFLYRFIPVQPISLKDVWQRFVAANPDLNPPESLAELPFVKLTLSHGPSPTIETIDGSEPWPSGRLNFHYEVSYKNPLEPRLRDIAKRIKQFNELLEIQRVNYLEPMKNESEEVLQDIEASSRTIVEEIRTVRQSIEQIG
ncbi:MAG: hypothetical protein AAF683_01360 [Pseudomonadota bacterium]